MKKTILMAALAVFTFISGNLFAGAQDFILTNNTNQTILHVYVSSSDSTDWEEDVLGKQVIRSGESIAITFEERAETFWDIRVVYAGGKSDGIWNSVNLKKIYEAVLTENYSGGTTLSYREI